MKNIVITKSQVALFILLSFLMITVSCNSNSDKKKEAVNSNSESATELAKQDTIKVTLNANDKMQFDKDEIVVYKGQTVVLELIHTGTMPKESMGHNFVLLDNSISVSKYSNQALKKKVDEYVIKDPEYTLAYTKMLGGGESDEITFKAPEEGEYDFICSFPGHYANMKGKFIVR